MTGVGEIETTAAVDFEGEVTVDRDLTSVPAPPDVHRVGDILADRCCCCC